MADVKLGKGDAVWDKATWDGKYGKAFSDFSDAFESFTTSVYAEAVAKGIDKPADGLLRMFYKRLGPDHPAVEQMARMLKAMGRSLELIRLGWLEQVSATPEEIETLQTIHPRDTDIEKLVQRSLQRNYTACYEAFTLQGCVITSQALADYLVKYKVTPEQYLVQLQQFTGTPPAPVAAGTFGQDAKNELHQLLYGRAAPTASAYAPDPDEATARRASTSDPPETPAAARPEPPPLPQTPSAAFELGKQAALSSTQSVISELTQAFKQMTQHTQVQKGPVLMTAVVDGLVVTRQQAGLYRLMDMLFAAFGIAGDSELELFLELKKEGAQGDFNIPQFKAKIDRLYKSLLPVGKVQPSDHKRVFASGLKQSSHRAHAKQLLAFNPDISLQELSDALTGFEQQQQAERHLELEVSVRTKATASSSSSKATPVSADWESTVMARKALQQPKLDKMREKATLEAAYITAVTHPNDKSAICTTCNVNYVPHLVGFCKNRSAGTSANLAASSSSVPACADRSGGAAAHQKHAMDQFTALQTQSRDTQVAMLGAKQEAEFYKQQFQALQAVAGQGATQPSGFFRAHPKPQAEFGGRRQQRGGRGYQQRRPPPQPTDAQCQLCGYALGHQGAVCFCEDPRTAPDSWMGPSSMTWLRGVHSYVRFCCRERLPLKITRCISKVLLIVNDLEPVHREKVMQAVKQAMHLEGGDRAVALMAQAPAQLPAPAVPLALPAPEVAGSSAAAEAAHQAFLAAQAFGGVNPFGPAYYQGNVVVLEEEPPEETPEQAQQLITDMLLAHQTLAEKVNPFLRHYNATFSQQLREAVTQQAAQTSDAPTEDLALVSTRASSSSTTQQPKLRSFTLQHEPLPQDTYAARIAKNQALLRDYPAAAVDGAISHMGHDITKQIPDLSDGCTHDAACREACGICRAESWTQQAEGIAVIEKITQLLKLQHDFSSSSHRFGTADAEATQALCSALSAQDTVHSADSIALTAEMGNLTPQQRVILKQPSNHKLLLDVLQNVTAGTGVPKKPPIMCVQQVVYLFEPVHPNHSERQSKLLGLDRIVGTSMAEGLVLTTPDSRTVLVENAVVDNGSQAPIITEVACTAWGLVIITTQIVVLRGIDGKCTDAVLGRTQPLTLTLCKGCYGSVNLLLPDGAIVIKGDAGGLYQMILDKRTLQSVYGYVDPALDMLIFRPFANHGRFHVLNGVPVVSVASGSDTEDLRAKGLLGPVTESAGAVLIAQVEDDVISTVPAGESPVQVMSAGEYSVFSASSSTATADRPAVSDEQSLPDTQTDEQCPPSQGEAAAEVQSAATNAATGWFGLGSAVDMLLCLLVMLLSAAFQLCVNKPLCGLPGRLLRMLWRRDIAVDLGSCCRAVATAGCRSFLFMVLLLCGLYDYLIDRPLMGFPSWALQALTSLASQSCWSCQQKSAPALDSGGRQPLQFSTPPRWPDPGVSATSVGSRQLH